MAWPMPVLAPVTMAVLPRQIEGTVISACPVLSRSAFLARIVRIGNRCHKLMQTSAARSPAHRQAPEKSMKIALIIENSQAAKSEIVHAALTAVAEPLGHQVFHYGMYTPEDKASLTYVMNGLLTGILLNSGAADFVVTGCGTGMGSMLACQRHAGRVLRPGHRPDRRLPVRPDQ
jgi:hypothetical protein